MNNYSRLTLVIYSLKTCYNHLLRFTVRVGKMQNMYVKVLLVEYTRLKSEEIKNVSIL